MTPLKIPKSAHEAIQALIRLSAGDFSALLEALTRAEPALDTDKFWTHVAPHAKQLDGALIQSILREVFEMAEVRTSEEVDDFAEAIAEAASEARSEGFPFDENDRKTLKDRLVKIFEGSGGLEITMKAAGVVADQDHLFLQGRVLTDIRPVFDREGKSVDAAVIVHNLRIHYAESADDKDFYVALDTGDLRSLRAALDRAEKKAECLQILLKNSVVPYLDPKE